MTRDELKGMRIGVLMGGRSAERDVSLSTGRSVAEALREKGYSVVEMDAGGDIPYLLAQEGVGAVFVALHGRFGEDGTVQGLLESLRIPYTGSGVLASALGMDKVRSRWIFQHLGIPVPEYRVVYVEEAAGFSLERDGLSLPIVVKPAREGSSVGVSIVRDHEELPSALDKAFSFGSQVLAERYIRGREIQVGILDNEALGAIEIRPKLEFYDYRAKYTEGLAEHIFPAPLRSDLYEEGLRLALAAHKALGCEGATRVDLLLEEETRFYVLEVNTLPGMTPVSLLPEIARGVGISFPDLCERILTGARLKA